MSGGVRKRLAFSEISRLVCLSGCFFCLKVSSSLSQDSTIDRLIDTIISSPAYQNPTQRTFSRREQFSLPFLLHLDILLHTPTQPTFLPSINQPTKQTNKHTKAFPFTQQRCYPPSSTSSKPSGSWCSSSTLWTGSCTTLLPNHKREPLFPHPRSPPHRAETSHALFVFSGKIFEERRGGGVLALGK